MSCDQNIEYNSFVSPLIRSLSAIYLMFILFGCEKGVESTKDGNNFVAVYPNSGNILTFVDYNSLEVNKQIVIQMPDSLNINRMCLSTNKDYFVFIMSTGFPHYSSYIASYDIARGELKEIFPTGLDSVGAPRLSAAYLRNEPGLIYLFSHSVGLYSLDYSTGEIKMISSDTDQGLDKFLFECPDQNMLAMLEQHGSEPTYSEIKLYTTNSHLASQQLTLNKDNQDSIEIDDLAFPEDNGKVFITIRSEKTRYIECYFGSYDLQTKKLYKSELTFPWSLNPYYMAYSSRRNECYTVGAGNKFYIIGTESSNYYLKDTIDLLGKISSPSRILIRPDENVAFVSCVYNNSVFAIDLERRQILKTISVEAAYQLLLL